MQEVSRVRSSKRMGRISAKQVRLPLMKGRIQAKKLHPQYVAGFIDGEGSFVVSFGRHRTLKRGTEIRVEFTIELRADDVGILKRILKTIGCGRIYDVVYKKYGWYPHVKYKVTSTKDLAKYLLPFLDKTPLQAKKGKVYKVFREIVLMVCRKEHLTDIGFTRIRKLRDKYRKYGKKPLGNR